MKEPGEKILDVGLWTVTGAVLVVLYAPVIICALFSVVEVSRGTVQWSTFTFDWYVRLWENQSILSAIRSTLIVGFASVLAASVLAVLLAFYVDWDGAIGRRFIELTIYLPFLLPPIVTGLALLVFFSQVGIARNLLAVAIGHTLFVTAVVYRLTLMRLQSLPKSLAEASADLGASRVQTIRYVLWPQLRPAVLTGAILALTMSFDETLISVFLAGNETTLPLRLWAMMRVGFNQEINALVTVVLVASIALTVAVAVRMRNVGSELQEG